jgi:hypothetical protein
MTKTRDRTLDLGSRTNQTFSPEPLQLSARCSPQRPAFSCVVRSGEMRSTPPVAKSSMRSPPFWKDCESDIMINRILNCDAVTGMRSLPNDFVPLTVTSPPYDAIRDYGGHHFDFQAIATELWRVTRPGGVVCWHVQDQIVDGSESCTIDRQTLFFRDLGFTLYQRIYVFAMSFRRSKRRYYRHTSIVLVLSKGRPDTVNLLSDRPNNNAGRLSGGGLSYRKRDGTLKRTPSKINPTHGVRGDCWVYDVGGGKTTNDRYAFSQGALMPERLARDLIRSYSVPRDLVLDPMAGAATTPKMALLTHRRYLGFEPWDKAYTIAERRMQDAYTVLTDLCLAQEVW